MPHPVMLHPRTKTVTPLTAETLLEQFREAVVLRPWTPAPASGKRILDRIGRNLREALPRPG